MPRLIFIISMPRSGSTVLQKILSVNPDVASTAEPWIMLPFWAMRDGQAMRAIYDHQTCSLAINDFIEDIPNGEVEFDQSIRIFAENIYRAAANGKPIFLDKTPRYYLAIPFLKRIFPDAKFVLITRNPLAVFASLCETFQKGRFVWMDHWIDWIEGQMLIAQALRTNDANQFVVKYEELVESPNLFVPRLCEWLGLEFQSKMIEDYHGTNWTGRFGDPTGVHKYNAVSSASIEKWRSFFGSSYRKRVAVKMLSYVSDDDLMSLGYPRSELISSLDTMKMIHGFDMRARFWGAVNSIATTFDYRYLKARWAAKKSGGNHAYGYFRF